MLENSKYAKTCFRSLSFGKIYFDGDGKLTRAEANVALGNFLLAVENSGGRFNQKLQKSNEM